ncbi:MAG: PhoU domain-containing protein, partial [Gemmatimonadota bacterium]
MIFDLFRNRGGESLDRVATKIEAMLRNDRHAFDLAMAALMAEKPAAEVNDEVRATDQAVNRLEREIRRELLVHTSVYGAFDTPAVLVHMSIVKDVERVGDYAKNLLDLARDGSNFSEVDDAVGWGRLATEISALISDAGEAFLAHDRDRSLDVRSRGEILLRSFDEQVTALVSGQDRAPQGIARALAYRYLKRIVAHLMNLVSAVIMPLDQLDHFDEDP